MKAGLSHYEAVTAIYALQAGMVGLAYLLRWQSDTLIVPLYLLLAGAVLALFVAAGHGLIPPPAPQSVRVRSNKWLSDLLGSPWLRDLPIRFLAAVVPLFLIATVFLPAQVPQDVGLHVDRDVRDSFGRSLFPSPTGSVFCARRTLFGQHVLTVCERPLMDASRSSGPSDLPHSIWRDGRDGLALHAVQ